MGSLLIILPYKLFKHETGRIRSSNVVTANQFYRWRMKQGEEWTQMKGTYLQVSAL